MPFGLSTVAVKAIGIGLLVLALIAGYALFVAHQRELGRVEERAKSSAAAMQMAQDNAAKSAQVAATQQGIAHDAQLQARAADAAAARAAAARDSFRVQLDAYVSAGRGPRYPGPASGGEAVPGGDPIGVLADVLGRSDARSDVVERLADQRGIRAIACERSYDALKAVK